MLRTIIETCIHRRTMAILAILVVAVLGIRAYIGTPIEAFPDVTNAQVTVITQAPGLAPMEVERQLTVPLERALNGTPKLLVLRSESMFGLSLVTLTFTDDADAFVARTVVSQRLQGADLPAGVIAELAPEATPLGEIYQYRLTSDRHDLVDLRGWQEWTVARMLRQVPGVADVISFGGFFEEVHVEVDPVLLETHELTLADVDAAIAASNVNVGGGFLRAGDQQLSIRGIGYLTAAEDVKRVVLRADGGTPVLVGDVARVVRSHTPRMGTVGYDDERDVVEGFVLLRRGENPSRVLADLHVRVEEINARVLPSGMAIVPFYDRSELVDLTLTTVHRNLLEGFLLITAVVWLFLRSLRGSAIVAVVIPLALASAFIGLHWLGVPANLISMGAIDFGILVDGAVVLVENVLHEARVRRPQRRREMIALVGEAAVDVARPTFFAMAIILAALIPVFSLERVEGRIFHPLALTYSLALTGALVLSLTVVPALCALLLRPGHVAGGEPRTIAAARGAYVRILGWLLRRRWAAVALAAGILTAGGALGGSLGSEFLPELDEGDLVVFVEMPASISLERGQEVLSEVRRRLLAFPEVTAALSEQGRPEDGTDNEGVNMSETFVRLRPRDSWRPGLDKEGLARAMRATLAEIPGVRFNISQPIKDNVEESVSGVRGKVVLKVFGDDLDAMHRTLLDATQVLRAVDGVVDLDLYRDTTAPQLQIRFDREALARHGVAMADAQAVVETALAGRIATEFWRGERVVPVRVRLPTAERLDVGRIAGLLLPTPSGARIPMRELAALEIVAARATINREANSRTMALKFNVEGRDLGGAIAEAMRTVEDSVTLPEGAWLVWSGEFENQERALARLRVVIPLSLLVVVGLLYSALQSGRAALAIMLIVPPSLCGGLYALAAAGEVLSVSAAIGFVALLGQVSLAGLLVVGAIENHRADGALVFDAVRQGCRDRLRAVLMTALLAMLGLLPMALAVGVGSETQRPFALVIVGGMATTLVMALFVLPVVYLWVAGRARRRLDEEED